MCPERRDRRARQARSAKQRGRRRVRRHRLRPIAVPKAAPAASGSGREAKADAAGTASRLLAEQSRVLRLRGEGYPASVLADAMERSAFVQCISARLMYVSGSGVKVNSPPSSIMPGWCIPTRAFGSVGGMREAAEEEEWAVSADTGIDSNGYPEGKRHRRGGGCALRGACSPPGPSS